MDMSAVNESFKISRKAIDAMSDAELHEFFHSWKYVALAQVMKDYVLRSRRERRQVAQ